MDINGADAADAVLSACGGGVGTSAEPEPPVVAACVPTDPSTAAECGTVIIGLTDADGDFLSYTVDVLSVTLEKANGAVVDVLPNATRIDFSQYVDLTEFISVTTIHLVPTSLAPSARLQQCRGFCGS